VLNNTSCLFNLKKCKRALDYYEQALPLSPPVGDRAGEAMILRSLGLVYSLFERSRGAGLFRTVPALCRPWVIVLASPALSATWVGCLRSSTRAITIFLCKQAVIFSTIRRTIDD